MDQQVFISIMIINSLAVLIFFRQLTDPLIKIFSRKLKKDYTHSLKFDRFHNLGKSFYYLIINNKKLKISKIFTFPALINYILTNKLYLDKSYLACHSFAWNFKKKN